MRQPQKFRQLPAFKHRQGSAPILRNQLKQLQKEVSQSHIAIENISGKKVIGIGLQLRLVKKQQQLHDYVLILNREQQKHRILSQLIPLLNNAIKGFKHYQGPSDQEANKYLHKVEFDVKQILNRQNQQIAKIAQLRQQVRAARDQRVVFSNIFNKMQKQIKRHDTIYREAIMDNQLYVLKSFTNPTHRRSYTSETITPTNLSVKLEHQLKEKTKTLRLTSQRSSDCQEQLFLTHPRQTDRIQPFIGNSDEESSRSIEELIRTRETEIQRILSFTHCRSLQEVFQVYGTVDSQNGELVSRIAEFDEDIRFIEGQIIRQKRYSESFDGQLLSQISNCSRKRIKSRSARSSVYSHCGQPEEAQTILLDICELLKVDPENLGEDVLRQIDTEIDKLNSSNPHRQLFWSRCKERDGKILQDLLQKMEPFLESDRILEREALRKESHREISKFGRKTKRNI